MAVALEHGGERKLAAYELVALVGLGLAAATCAALGALIVAQTHGHRLGVAFLAGGVGVSCWLLATAWIGVPATSGRPLLEWAAWVDNWIFVGLIVLGSSGRERPSLPHAGLLLRHPRACLLA
jgi:hypothetical protein